MVGGGYLGGIQAVSREKDMVSNSSRMRIKEVIVVEGRDDISAVKRAVDAHVIAVHGYGVFRRHILEEIWRAQERVGVIVLTDPDWAGEKIRRSIEQHVPGIKHAFIPRSAGRRELDGNIGVEHAEPSVICESLQQARCQVVDPVQPESSVSVEHLMEHGLVGHPVAEARRYRLGEKLGIGRVNSKQFLRRIQHFGISLSEFLGAVASLDQDL